MPNQNPADLGNARALLFAIMLGFSESTRLAPGMELMQEPTEVLTLDAAERDVRRFEDVPSYWGNPWTIADHELDGRGSLFRRYASRVLIPSTTDAKLSLLTSVVPLRSGMFEVFKAKGFDQKGSPLPQHGLISNERIILPSTYLINDKTAILASDQKATKTIVTTITQEIAASAEAPKETIQAIHATFGLFAQQLSVLLHQEFAAIRADIAVLQQTQDEQLRAVLKTVDDLAHPNLIRTIFKETPKRAAENAIDAGVEEAAKKAAGLLVKVISSALLS